MPLFLCGCGPGGDNTSDTGTTTIPSDDSGLSQSQLASILATAVNKHQGLNTYKYTMDMLTITEIIGGSQAGKITMDAVVSGASNAAAQEQYMKMETTIQSEGNINDSPPFLQNLIQEFYLLPDWLYVKLDVTDLGVMWGKSVVTNKIKQTYNLDNVDKQIDALESPDRIEYLRSEKVNGVDCFVLSVTPNDAALVNWLSQQNTGTMEPNWEQLGQMAQAIKSLNYTCYVTKDSYILVRMVVKIQMEFEPEMIGAGPSEFDIMASDMDIDLLIYDQDISWNIVLPDDAAYAILIGGDDEMFLPQ
jgi:hypothetical protein